MIDYNKAKTMDELDAFHEENVAIMGQENYNKYGEPLFMLYTAAFTRIKHSSEALGILEGLKGNVDLECSHGVADEVLCRVLRSLGCENVVDSYSRLNKWYA